jgi:hypothetical protein
VVGRSEGSRGEENDIKVEVRAGVERRMILK